MTRYDHQMTIWWSSNGVRMMCTSVGCIRVAHWGRMEACCGGARGPHSDTHTPCWRGWWRQWFDERQKLSLSHFAFAIALLSGWGPTSSTHLSFHLVFSLVPRNFSLGDEPFAEPSAGMSEGYGQLLLLNAVRSQRGLLIWVFPSVSLSQFERGETISWHRALRWPMLIGDQC